MSSSSMFSRVIPAIRECTPVLERFLRRRGYR
jgi:hypothetical protein